MEYQQNTNSTYKPVENEFSQSIDNVVSPNFVTNYSTKNQTNGNNDINSNYKQKNNTINALIAYGLAVKPKDDKYTAGNLLQIYNNMFTESISNNPENKYTTFSNDPILNNLITAYLGLKLGSPNPVLVNLGDNKTPSKTSNSKLTTRTVKSSNKGSSNSASSPSSK